MVSVLESLVLRPDNNLCDYTEGRIISSRENRIQDRDYKGALEDYRNMYYDGFDEDVVLGDDKDDYMYSADTSDAVKKVLAYYSPYVRYIMDNIPNEDKIMVITKDFHSCDQKLKSEERWEDEHYRRIMGDMELCIMTAVGLTMNYRQETENVTWENTYEFVSAVLEEMVESDTYPGLAEFPKSIRQGMLAPVFSFRAYYLVRGIAMVM